MMCLWLDTTQNLREVTLMKQTVEEYVTRTKHYFPNIPTDQLISMVILHFDIPDKEAKQKVEEIIGKENQTVIVPPKPQEYWACWNCGEQNLKDFFDCWKCHKPKQKQSFIV